MASVTPVAILNELARRHAVVRIVERDREQTLEVRPARVLDDALKAAIRAHRSTLIGLVAQGRVIPPSAPAPCAGCGNCVAWQAGDGMFWCSQCAPSADPRTVRWWYATDDDDLEREILSPDAIRALDALTPDEQREVVALLRSADETRDANERRRHIERVVAWVAEGRRRLGVGAA